MRGRLEAECVGSPTHLPHKAESRGEDATRGGRIHACFRGTGPSNPVAMRPTDQPPPRPRPASIAANGGITAATTLIPTATGMDQKRTTFHARTMRATHVPMSQKYVALAPGRF